MSYLHSVRATNCYHLRSESGNISSSYLYNLICKTEHFGTSMENYVTLPYTLPYYFTFSYTPILVFITLLRTNLYKQQYRKVY